MRALTVRQPWAWAIVHGGKDVENRTRNVAGSYRGPVAIHAGLTFDKHNLASVAHRAAHGSEVPTVLVFGAVVGVVDLVDVKPPCVCPDADGATCSPWCIPGHHHLWLENPRPLHVPIPAKGRLGLWTPEPELLAAIREQVPA